jgi:hypothetical protein
MLNRHDPREMDAGDLMAVSLIGSPDAGCSHVGMKHAMLYLCLFSLKIFGLNECNIFVGNSGQQST